MQNTVTWIQASTSSKNKNYLSESLELTQKRLEEVFQSDALKEAQDKFFHTYRHFVQAIEGEFKGIDCSYTKYESWLSWNEEVQKEYLDTYISSKPSLQTLYNELLVLIPNSEFIKIRLWNEILWELALAIYSKKEVVKHKSHVIDFSRNGEKQSITLEEETTHIQIQHIIRCTDVKYILNVFTTIGHLVSVSLLDLSDNRILNLDENQLNTLFSQLTNLKSIYLENCNLWYIDDTRLHAVFSHLENLRNIKLSNNDLWKMDNTQLHALFSHLGNLKSIDLSRNMLRDFDMTQCHTLFSHLSSIWNADLSFNLLWELDDTQLFNIFSHLRNLKCVNLSNNALNNLNETRLYTIFSCFVNLRSIKISNNTINGINEKGLNIIFSHLSNIRSIDLSHNSLWSLNDSQLHAIFSHLKNIHTITLLSEPTDFYSRLESLFPSLKWKIIMR